MQGVARAALRPTCPFTHFNQGDAKSGRIARADVAAIAIESLASAASFDTTFECYDGDTAKVSQLVTTRAARDTLLTDGSRSLTCSLAHSLTHVPTHARTYSPTRLHRQGAQRGHGEQRQGRRHRHARGDKCDGRQGAPRRLVAQALRGPRAGSGVEGGRVYTVYSILCELRALVDVSSREFTVQRDRALGLTEES